MALAFSQQERMIIVKQLKEVVIEHLQKTGVRKTTIEDLTNAVGISKSAFYNFYVSKEALFYEVYIEARLGLFEKTKQMLEKESQRPMKERMSMVFKDAYEQVLAEVSSTFSPQDILHLERKLPREWLEEHNKRMQECIDELQRDLGVFLRIPVEKAIVIVQIILHTCVFSKEIGEGFEEAIGMIIDSVCAHLVE